MAEAVLGQPQGLESFTAVLDLEFSRLIIIDWLFIARGLFPARADGSGPRPMQTDFYTSWPVLGQS